MLTRLVKIAVKIRRDYNPQAQSTPQGYLNPDGIEVIGPDITERDNAVLAMAASRIYPVLSDLFDRDGIDEFEFLRLVYRMAGEVYDEDIRTPKMKKKPLAPGRDVAQQRLYPPSTPRVKNPADPGKNPTGPDEQGPA